MNAIRELFQTYLMILVHPFRMHQQFRYKVSLPDHSGHLYAPLTLAESIGVSWIFSLLRGLGKIIIINFFLQSFLNWEDLLIFSLLHLSQKQIFPFLFPFFFYV